MRFLRLLLPLLLFLGVAAAQDMVLDQTLSEAGATNAMSRSNGERACTACGVHLIPTGSPTGCAGVLEGSETGVTGEWESLGGTADTTEGDCAEAVAFSVINRPMRYVRFNLTTLSGGTTPTVRVLIRAVQ